MSSSTGSFSSRRPRASASSGRDPWSASGRSSPRTGRARLVYALSPTASCSPWTGSRWTESAPKTRSSRRGWLDRLELLERLPAALAVAERAARRRPEDVLELRLRRAAVGTAEDACLQLDEPRRVRFPRRRRCEARLAKLLATGGRDPVGRPRVVRDHRDVGPGAELRDLLFHRPLHHLERGAAEEGGRELDPDVPVLDIDRADDSELDERDDRDLGIRDLLERLPDLGLPYHCAPAGAERRTIVISSQSGASSSVCEPRSTASTSARPTRSTSSPRSSAGRRPSAYGHSSSTAALKRGSSRSRSCHISACMRW